MPRQPTAQPVRPPTVPPRPRTSGALTGVRVSPLTAQVREIGSRLVNETDDDIDTAKVEEIRQAIAEGQDQDRSQQDRRWLARFAARVEPRRKPITP